MSEPLHRRFTEFKPTSEQLKKAREQLSLYTLMVEPVGDGEFLGTIVELPGVLSNGSSVEQCVHNLLFLGETYLASDLADHIKFPPPHKKKSISPSIKLA